MPYLNKLLLNPTNSQVQIDLGNFYDLHRTLKTSLIKSGYQNRFLYRVDYLITDKPINLLLQTEMPVDLKPGSFPSGYLLDAKLNKDISGLMKVLQQGMKLKFFFRANPVAKIRSDNKKYPSKVPLVHPTTIEKEERAYQGYLNWLLEKAKESGFDIISTDFVRTNVFMWRKNAKSVSVPLFVVDFEGILKVKDENRLYEAIIKGIGPSKSLGMGMLSLGMP